MLYCNMKCVVSIRDVYNITGIGVVIAGQVKSGALNVGSKLNLSGRIMPVKNIERDHKSYSAAHPGDNIGFALGGADAREMKAFVGKDLEFSDEGNVVVQAPLRAVPSRPEGLFGALKKLFGGN